MIFLTVDEVSKHVKEKFNIDWPVNTLNKWRSQGRGPRYCRLNGRILYTDRDVEFHILNAKFVETEMSNRV